VAEQECGGGGGNLTVPSPPSHSEHPQDYNAATTLQLGTFVGALEARGGDGRRDVDIKLDAMRYRMGAAMFGRGWSCGI
jgi:hypothetical protein